MPAPPDSLFDWIDERRQEALPRSDDVPALAADGISWRAIAAAIGLAIAGVAAPVAVTALAASGMGLAAVAACALVALLVLAPAGVCFVAALSGAQRAAAQAVHAGHEAEQAVLRVFADTVLFGYALAIATLAPWHTATDLMLVAAAGLVAAWAILACVIQWPSAPPLRRHAAIALDAALFSAFLLVGREVVAGWYPFYLLLILYAGLRFGLDALSVAAVAAALGFAAVILSTDFWRGQPSLAGGLLFALAALPICFAATIHALAAARSRAAGAEAERKTALRLIADTLSGPAVPAPAGSGPSAAIGDVRDFAALEAGTFSPPIESFDLRALIRRSLMPLRAKAAERGGVLRWRVDPRVPDRLRGHAQALTRILAGLADYAIELGHTATIRLAVDAAMIDAGRLQLKLRLDGFAARRDRRRGGDADALSLRLAERLIKMAHGAFAVDRRADRDARLTVTLPLAIEASSAARPLDLGRRAVLIATADDELARELAEPLAMWNADPSWPGGVAGDVERALAEVSHRGEGKRPVLIADGREKLLSALNLAHQAARLGEVAPFVVLIVQQDQIAGLGEVEEAGLDGFMPAPVTEAMLANALDALPLEADVLPPAAAAIPKPARAVAEPSLPVPSVEAQRITPIAAHPKFAPETTAAILDPRVIEGLRALDGDPKFLEELIETFRTDARRVMQRLSQAAAAADAASFGRCALALQRAAAQFGGTQLCELLASWRNLTEGDLRQRGAGHVTRLEAEIERLLSALSEYPPSGATRQG